MRLKCWYGIHEPSGESIIPAVDECWLKKCKYCNRYILHGVGCSVDVSKRKAMKLRDEIYRELGELRLGRENNG